MFLSYVDRLTRTKRKKTFERGYRFQEEEFHWRSGSLSKIYKELLFVASYKHETLLDANQNGKWSKIMNETSRFEPIDHYGDAFGGQPEPKGNQSTKRYSSSKFFKWKRRKMSKNAFSLMLVPLSFARRQLIGRASVRKLTFELQEHSDVHLLPISCSECIFIR